MLSSKPVGYRKYQLKYRVIVIFMLLDQDLFWKFYVLYRLDGDFEHVTFTLCTDR
jgi:hypothetical protein